MEIVPNMKYFYADHFVIVKSKGTKFRWLLLDSKNNLIGKSRNLSTSPEEAYLDAISTVKTQ